MKKSICVLLASIAISASASTYVTVTDCNGGETGTQCSQITYKVRPASPSSTHADVELYPMGEGSYGPAPKVTGGSLLKLLQNLGSKKTDAEINAKYQRQVEQYLNTGGN